MDNYNFKDFLKKIQDLDFLDMIVTANAKCVSLEKGHYGVRGGVKKREAGNIALAEKIKALSFWLQNGVKPAGLAESEFQMFKPICIKLIEKKQLKNKALEIFNHKINL